MRKNPIFLVLLAILVAQPLLVGNLGVVSPGESNGVFTPALGTRLAPSAHTNHVPILIDGDDDFVSQGWPGSGTSGDPYIISGLNITYATGMVLITITDTRAYFVIRDCYINQGSSTYGVFLNNATHGVIEHFTARSNDIGIYLYQANDTTISQTEVASVDNSLLVEYSWDCFVEYSEFDSEHSRSSYWYDSPNPTLNYNYWNADPGDDNVVEMDGCNNTVITHSIIVDGFYGLTMYNSYDVEITDLTLTEVTYGMYFIVCGEVDIADSYSESPETTLYMDSCNDSSVVDSEFWCDDSGDYAIGIFDSHRFIFTGNSLEDAQAYGLVIETCEDSVVNSNTFTECEPVGLLLADCPDSEVIGNTVLDSGGSGIETYDSPRCTIHNNNIHYAETGIYGENSDNSTYIGNTLDYHLGGIYLTLADYVNVSDNLVTDAEYGIYLDSSTWCRIHDNTVSDVSYGLYFTTGEDFDVYNNDIMSATDTGIYLTAHDDMHIHHNTITDSEDGIQMSSSCDRTRVEDNTLDIAELGITVRGVNSSIVNNDITNAELMGMWLGSTTNCEVRGNTISGAPQFGISSSQGINISLIDNVFTDCGFILETSAGMAYYNHTISGNTVNGLPMYYAVNDVGGSINLASYGQIILLNCSYMDIIGATVGQVSAPVQLFYCLNITVSDIVSSPNIRTITSYETDNVTITDIISVGRQNDWEFSSAGIYLNYCDNFQIENFDHYGGYYGIRLYYADYGSIVSSTVDHAVYGIYASTSCDNVTVDYCDVTNLQNFGIRTYGNYWTVTNCYAFNTSYGIYAGNGVDHFYADNVLVNNQRGISITGGSTNNGIIHHNEITDNTNYGIYITSGNTWDILNNTILWNGLYGIYLTGSSGTEVYYNIIGISGTANGYDSIAQNWDDGVDTGNWWSDYDGISPTYNTAGNGVDNYPMRFLPTTPIINHPMDLHYAEGSTGNEITWLVYDDYLSHYSVSIDGSVWAATACPGLTLSEITIEVDGLAYGNHAVVITVWDIEDNTVSNSLTIHVFDDTPPKISSEPNMDAFVSGSGQEVTWEVYDLHPGTYTVTIDDVISASGTWTSGDLSANIDGLAAGYHTVRMTIYDTDGNSAYDALAIHVISDSTSPTIDSPADLTIVYGSTGNRIIWTPADEYPAGYEVSFNSSVLLSDEWGGSRIILDIDGLEVGEYTFTLTVWDGSGNEVSDAVNVEVIPFEGWTPSGAPPDYTMVIITVGVVAGVIVIVVAVYFLKFKKS